MFYDFGFPLIAPAGSETGISEYSEPIALKGDNVVNFQAVAVNLNGATNIGYRIQSSNDMKAWTNEGSAVSITAVATPSTTKITGIGGQYVRVRFWGTGAAALLAGSITTSRQ